MTQYSVIVCSMECVHYEDERHTALKHGMLSIAAFIVHGKMRAIYY